MTRTQHARRILAVLIVGGTLSAGVVAQQPAGESTTPTPDETASVSPAASELLAWSDGGRNYSDITVTPEEAYLDLRADTTTAARLLAEVLTARGESVPGGVSPETWFHVGDAWMRIEPLPYMPGAWSRLRVRVGAFETDAERHQAEDLLSEIAFRLDAELGVVSEDPAAEEAGEEFAAEPYPYPQSVQGGYRAGGATDIGLAVDAAQDAAAQQPIQLYAPIEINTTTYDNGGSSYDDSYGYGYGDSGYRSYGRYAYGYCSPWAYSWLSYCRWNYGYRYGWHGYRSYYAWCSPYSGWGWHPYGSWWSGSHYANCSCSTCASVVYYADGSDDQADDTGDDDSGGGGTGTNGGDDNGGGPGGHGGGLVATAGGTSALPRAASPVLGHTAADVLGFQPRVDDLDPGDGPARRDTDGLLGNKPATTVTTPTTAPTLARNDDVLSDGPSGGMTGSGDRGRPGGLTTDSGSTSSGGRGATGAGTGTGSGSGGVVQNDPPSTPPTSGRTGWHPTVRTVTARTVRVGTRSAGLDARPTVRTSVPTRSSSSSRGSSGYSSSSGSPIVRSSSVGRAPPIRVSTPTILSRSVVGTSRRGSSSTVTSVTDYGTSRSVPTSTSRSSGRTISFPTSGSSAYTPTSRGSSISTGRTSIASRPTSVSRPSSSRSLPTFNRSSPVPSRGTALSPGRSSSGRSTSAGRSSSGGSRSAGRSSGRGRSSSGGRSSSSGGRSGRGR